MKQIWRLKRSSRALILGLNSEVFGRLDRIPPQVHMSAQEGRRDPFGFAPVGTFRLDGTCRVGPNSSTFSVILDSRPRIL